MSADTPLLLLEPKSPITIQKALQAVPCAEIDAVCREKEWLQRRDISLQFLLPPFSFKGGVDDGKGVEPINRDLTDLPGRWVELDYGTSFHSSLCLINWVSQVASLPALSAEDGALTNRIPARVSQLNERIGTGEIQIVRRVRSSRRELEGDNRISGNIVHLYKQVAADDLSRALWRAADGICGALIANTVIRKTLKALRIENKAAKDLNGEECRVFAESVAKRFGVHLIPEDLLQGLPFFIKEIDSRHGPMENLIRDVSLEELLCGFQHALQKIEDDWVGRHEERPGLVIGSARVAAGSLTGMVTPEEAYRMLTQFPEYGGIPKPEEGISKMIRAISGIQKKRYRHYLEQIPQFGFGNGEKEAREDFEQKHYEQERKVSYALALLRLEQLRQRYQNKMNDGGSQGLSQYESFNFGFSSSGGAKAFLAYAGKAAGGGDIPVEVFGRASLGVLIGSLYSLASKQTAVSPRADFSFYKYALMGGKSGASVHLISGEPLRDELRKAARILGVTEFISS